MTRECEERRRKRRAKFRYQVLVKKSGAREKGEGRRMLMLRLRLIFIINNSVQSGKSLQRVQTSDFLTIKKEYIDERKRSRKKIPKIL